MMSSDWGFSTMRVILTALSVVSVATATTSFDYTPEEDHSSGKNFNDNYCNLPIRTVSDPQNLKSLTMVTFGNRQRSLKRT